MPSHLLSALELREKPIPLHVVDPNDVSFRLYPVDLTREESREPLVDVADFGLAAQSFYARTDGLNAPYHRPLAGALPRVYLRRGVAQRLVRVNEFLRPHGIELFLLDGYRRIECQIEIYEWFLDITRRAMPDAPDDVVLEHVREFISRPDGFDRDNPTTWVSHVTGAAVDLTLRFVETGEHLYMGGLFDDPSEISHTDYFERPGAPAGASADEARRNRRLLFWSMAREEFACLPAEWWHYDFGDQLWAKNRRWLKPQAGRTTAWYGPADERF